MSPLTLPCLQAQTKRMFLDRIVILIRDPLPDTGENRLSSKATDVLVDLLKTAIHAGHSAKNVLFDTWFSTPKTICRIKAECNLDTIAMIKKSSRIKYEWNGKKYDIKEIYSHNKKRCGRSRYLLSVLVNVTAQSDDGARSRFRLKSYMCETQRRKKTGVPDLFQHGTFRRRYYPYLRKTLAN